MKAVIIENRHADAAEVRWHKEALLETLAGKVQETSIQFTPRCLFFGE